MPASEGAKLLGGLEAIMREAGELARVTSRGDFKRWTKGADNSPVSEGDIAVNNLLRARLTRLAPQAGWLSEETEDDLAGRSMASAWIVDPIDGTRAYIAGKPDWTISVALVDNARPALAALYAPVTDEMFLS
ncbi:MAG: 3'(2'),5'-bisphosphate nucleotidase CysQ, partial [Pseudolabrys sp.]|nr:3'(2'),5'-bisphosphate nucleotidase CysQ [Pseudolabrys sp.]